MTRFMVGLAAMSLMLYVEALVDHGRASTCGAADAAAVDKYGAKPNGAISIKVSKK